MPHLQCGASSRTQIALFPLRRERQNGLEWRLQSHLQWAQRGGLLLLTLSCSQLRQWMEQEPPRSPGQNGWLGVLKILPWSPPLGVLGILLHRRWGSRWNLLPNLCEFLKRPCDVWVHAAICPVWLANRISYSTQPFLPCLAHPWRTEWPHCPRNVGGILPKAELLNRSVAGQCTSESPWSFKN